MERATGSQNGGQSLCFSFLSTSKAPKQIRHEVTRGDADEIQRLIHARKHTPETTPDTPEQGHAQQKVIDDLMCENKELLSSVKEEQIVSQRLHLESKEMRLEVTQLRDESCAAITAERESSVKAGKAMAQCEQLQNMVKHLQDALVQSNRESDQLHQEVVEMHAINNRQYSELVMQKNECADLHEAKGLQEVRSSVLEAELNAHKQEKFMVDHEMFTLKALLQDLIQGRSQMESRIHSECESQRSIALAEEAQRSDQELEILSELANARNESGRLQVQLHLASAKNESSLRALSTEHEQALSELEIMSDKVAHMQKFANSEQAAYYSLLSGANRSVLPSNTDTAKQTSQVSTESMSDAPTESLSEAALRSNEGTMNGTGGTRSQTISQSFSETTLQPEGIDTTREQVDVLDAMLQLREPEGIKCSQRKSESSLRSAAPTLLGHNYGSSSRADNKTARTFSPPPGREDLMPYVHIQQHSQPMPKASGSAPQLPTVKGPILAGDRLMAASHGSRLLGSRSPGVPKLSLSINGRPGPPGPVAVTSPREIPLAKGGGPQQVQLRALSPRAVSPTSNAPVTLSTSMPSGQVSQVGSTASRGSLSVSHLQRAESPPLNGHYFMAQNVPQFAWTSNHRSSVQASEVDRPESPRHPSQQHINQALVRPGPHPPVTPASGVEHNVMQSETPRVPLHSTIENLPPRNNGTPGRSRITSCTSPNRFVVPSRSSAQLGSTDLGRPKGATPPRIFPR
eukprot:gnl/MRDRNA2_/MRDRNA2_96464_c0_seq1.p1 gnl/MRDRNA2_/MRDRNA2_96464_c0~~gnl/MRDRNA2_/MRDRNA2_96464_c0_seq1.p1  ORF type:complete len:745 (+),score=127.70 gnl/MRDRNA2_/MRDRNA2_96464_c0_seq1:96-2330(+)